MGPTKLSYNARMANLAAGLLVILAGLGIGGPAPVLAADRMIMAEQFTATWCGYCPQAGRALISLQDMYPDTFAMIQIHGQDGYETAWGTHRRFTFYAPWVGYPTVWFCGEDKLVGGDEEEILFNLYRGRYFLYRARPVDVSVTVGAEQVGGATYAVRAQVRMDADGEAKTVRLYIASVLNNYPTGTQYENCLVDPAPTVTDVSLEPGESAIVETQITFDPYNTNIELIAWVQEPYSTGPAIIYNADKMAYPLEILTPVGDMNCDGAIDSYDIDGFICAVSPACDYEDMYPTCDRQLADCNNDSAINAYDIDWFIDIMSGG
ncbi:MAG: hypothetical protein ABIG44_07020 [Planctomycetota bacterium]